MPLLEQFWSLSKTDYKSEVFKIINDAAYLLGQEHIEYLFNEITETPANKLGMEEFDALSGLGRHSKSAEFTTKTSEFFWRIISDSDLHKAELIENCINKFAEMIKLQSMEQKQPYFDKLVGVLSDNKSSCVPVIRLFKKIVKDQKFRTNYSTYNSTTTGTGAVSGTRVVSHGATTVGGTQRSSYSNIGGMNNKESIYPNAGGAADDDEDTSAANADAEESKQMTLKSCLDDLETNSGFVKALLANLGAYCDTVKAKIAADANLLIETNRTKLFILNAKHSHQEEVNERLSFLQEFAMNSSF